jgi:hypothetical protein
MRSLATNIRSKGKAGAARVRVPVILSSLLSPLARGRGLRLSISHDIIVKQHSGSIEVKFFQLPLAGKKIATHVAARRWSDDNFLASHKQ